MDSVSKKNKFQIFNSISNYHWIDNIRFKKSKGHKDNSTRYSSHLLWFPDDQDRRNHLPTSPRLQLMQFFLFEEEYKNSIGPLVTQLVQMDKGEENTHYVPPIKIKMKMKHISGLIVQVTPNQLQTTNQNIDMNEYQNDVAQDRSLYTKFTGHLLTQGNIKWHFHDE